LKNQGKQVDELNEKIDNYTMKYKKNKEKRREIKSEYDATKLECDKVNMALYNSIQGYEKRIADLKENFDNEMQEEKIRVDEFLKFNDDLRDSDLYSVYKELRKKFEEKLKECIEFRDLSEKISKEKIK
jgi:hypothetical protein